VTSHYHICFCRAIWRVAFALLECKQLVGEELIYLNMNVIVIYESTRFGDKLHGWQFRVQKIFKYKDII
jgi:hypothetical protein